MIFRIVVGPALFLFALSAACPVQAQITETYRAGLWHAYQGGQDANRPFCGIATSGGEGRRVAVQQYPGESGLELRLSKDSWAIPHETQIALQVQFDDHPKVAARGMGGEHDVNVALPFEQSVPFMRALRDGRILRVAFPEGTETMWTGGLAGSSSAINAFNNCRETLAPATPAQPTQPYRAQPATSEPLPALRPPVSQPFGSPTPG
jgi:hypothetical protein